MFTVGLTGGIGSGKTTVANLFAALGAGVIDTDAIAHTLTSPQGAAMPALRAAFGADIAAPDGSLDRHAMRDRVFDHPTERQRLEAILHPLIDAETRAAAARAGCRHPYLVFVVPLLVESGRWAERVDRVLVVDCDEETQIARVMARSGMDRARVLTILAAQADRTRRLAAAHDVIENSGPPATLAPRVARLHEKYCDLARRKVSNTG